MNEEPARAGPDGVATLDAEDAKPRRRKPSMTATIEAAKRSLDGRSLVLVGLMGAGKTTVGRTIAQTLSMPFIDADDEIEQVSRMSIADLFERFGEDEFRSLERRVIARLLEEGPHVLATGGGAFMNLETREQILSTARTVWLRAELDVLVERTARRSHRPLLRQGDPRTILARLIEERHPVYAQADLTVESTRERREAVASRVVKQLATLE